MDAVTESGRSPVSKYEAQPKCGERTGQSGTGQLNPFREAKFSGVNGERGGEIPVELTTSRIGNLNRSIHTLLKWMTTLLVPCFDPLPSAVTSLALILLHHYASAGCFEIFLFGIISILLGYFLL